LAFNYLKLEYDFSAENPFIIALWRFDDESQPDDTEIVVHDSSKYQLNISHLTENWPKIEILSEESIYNYELRLC